MSRYSDDYVDDWDEDDPDGESRTQAWDRKVREALSSEQGRAHLTAVRSALLALPEKRLISGALCTVGGVDAKLPAIGDEEMAAIEAKSAAWCAETGIDMGPDYPRMSARFAHSDREDHRERLADTITRENGGAEGVCLIGAYLWHRKVTLDGASSAEAFADLPALIGEDDEDPLTETADMGKEAGMPYELAWELAYRNDETYGRMTPEERYTAFLAWIDVELAGVTAR